MGVFTNGAVSRIFATLLSFLVITINVYFVISYVIGKALAIRVAISYDTGKMLYISYVIGRRKGTVVNYVIPFFIGKVFMVYFVIS